MTNLQQVKKEFGKTLRRKRKSLRKAKNKFVSSGLSITLMTSIEENKTNYTFESILKYADALGFEVVLREKGFDDNGNPIVTEEEFHTCDGLLKTHCKRDGN